MCEELMLICYYNGIFNINSMIAQYNARQESEITVKSSSNLMAILAVKKYAYANSDTGYSEILPNGREHI